jgi:lipopolysaccharide/colanic/teichoic acid biosynthesis glycosyltransferase
MKNEAVTLLIGDVLVLYGALYLSLAVRTFSVPDKTLWWQHALPFTLIFVIMLLTYFIAGLYDQHTTLVRQRIPLMVFVSQLIGSVCAAVFFFLIPAFGIAPKTILALFILFSSLGILGWRIVRLHTPTFVARSAKTPTMIIGASAETRKLAHEIEHNPRYRMHIAHHIDPAKVQASHDLPAQLRSFVKSSGIAVIVIDTKDPAAKHLTKILYEMQATYRDLRMYDVGTLYEYIFRRVPLSTLDEGWFFLSAYPSGIQSVDRVLRRTIDILLGAVGTCVYAFAVPVVWLLMRASGDKGALHITQERVGEYGTPIRITKFRSMTGSDSGTDVLKSALRVTPLGKLLRSTRIDELPQCVGVLRGDLSVVGPRPELPALAAVYTQEIPYYGARHTVRPGLTGWAQLYHDGHPHHGADVPETRNKLSYDLYYIKHQSFLLDLEIILKTIRKIIAGSGR